MNRRTLLAATSGAATMGMAGCFGLFGGDDEPQVAEEDIVQTITFDGRDFDPMYPTIEVDDAVEWHNDSNAPLRLRTNNDPSDAQSWDLKTELEPDETYAFQFSEEGIYSYHDDIQTNFRSCAVVLVGDLTEDDVDTVPCE